MNFFETLERLQRLHILIESGHTGTPDDLSRRLGVCRKTLYNMIEELKSRNAPIAYSRRRETFYYSKGFTLELYYRFTIIQDKEILRKIGGGYDFFTPCTSLHGNVLVLYSKVEPVYF